MAHRPVFSALLRDERGSMVVEFGLLAPVFLMLVFGMLQVAFYMQHLNAVQSLASDGARFVMIEYQKNNPLSNDQIREVLLSRATSQQYLLDTDRVQITVDRSGASRVTGATEIDLTVNYTLENFIPGVTLPLSVISYTRSVWVVT
ncbi:MAG: TadE/TadG family type IV pilus assembly protein [Erythrobacter sp.]|jgi:Flp pilus assembly protein TadG|uniref:TadE/TadG family type IV pilus assembly protein n=1 Tax=Erythrobacter sp. TaxID=1042 RepID=UPI002B4765D9|nr:TadE/TadG family type IV pilus assembly protein [Erythrobacter sp.]WRH69710.1 MAG: TadE/TadG family type IV pilus assembly protein [Erythrobacter sp.]